MANKDSAKIISRRTPESAAMVANVRRAAAITANLNRLTFNDADEIRVGRNVFVNQNCTFYDLGGLDIADDVMIGPNVSLITSGHPLEPSRRRAFTIAKPIVIERNVWIGAGATVIGGVTVGENSVVAAGSVVTKTVPPNTFVGGNPARVIRSIAE